MVKFLMVECNANGLLNTQLQMRYLISNCYLMKYKKFVDKGNFLLIEWDANGLMVVK